MAEKSSQLVTIDGLNKAYKVNKDRLDKLNGFTPDNQSVIGDKNVTDVYLGGKESSSNSHAKSYYISEEAFISYDKDLKAITFNFKEN